MNRDILKKLTYGMYIVTAKEENTLFGCVANSIMQINSDTVAISLNKINHTTNAILTTKKLGINILDIDTNIELITTFGFKKSKEYDKFANIKYEIKNDVPILNDSIGYIIGDVINTMETETHIIILIKIKDMDKLSNKEPMSYSYYQNNLKGQTNKNAPTYQEDKTISNKHVFVCKICGYKYETDLDELPDDFKCPLCGVGKENFEKIK